MANLRLSTYLVFQPFIKQIPFNDKKRKYSIDIRLTTKILKTGTHAVLYQTPCLEFNLAMKTPIYNYLPGEETGKQNFIKNLFKINSSRT